MKILYISNCTEYEIGWGNKPDGISISKDKTILEDSIKSYNNREKGSYECYWNYSKIEEIYCSDEDFDKIKFNDDGLFHVDSLKELKIELFKKI
jgi:hypothetical protein